MFDDLIQRIHELPKLTPSEKKIVKYFEAINEQIALKSIYDISSGAKVSVATVTRFVSRLGYKDFNDFKVNARRNLLDRVGSQWDQFTMAREQLLTGEEDLWSRFGNLVINELKAGLANITSESMRKAARLIADTPGRVYVMGQMNSYPVAHLFWQHLTLIRDGAILIDNQAGSPINHLVGLGSDDLLFAASYSAYTKGTSRVIETFAQQGRGVILLTDSAVSPVSRWASLQLVVPVEWSAPFGSRCSALMVVEGLVMYLARIREKALAERLGSYQRLNKAHGTFTDPVDGHSFLENSRVWRDGNL
jgi:DNA-binding MurR/RpiR family transcriptional regulator